MASRTAAKRYSIGAVARRTGLSEHVLRMWERRYRAIVPDRSGGSHRRYSERDVRRVRLLRTAQQGGLAIGAVASLSDAEIIRLLHQAARPAPADPLALQVYECERAIARLDPWRLTAILNRAAVRLGWVAVAEEIMAPVMRRIGERWSEGDLEPHHEHLATTTFRAFLDAALSMQRLAVDAPVVVAGAASGERHELGVLAAAVVAAGEGWRVVYLGADVPAAGMVATVAAHRPGAVLIGITCCPPAAAVLDDLHVVSGSVESGTLLLCGGAGAEAARPAIESMGAIVAGLDGIRATLRLRYASQGSA